jgi:cysteine-rich repeat protein
MRGLLLGLLVAGSVGGCHESLGLEGATDTSTDSPSDPVTDRVEVPPTGCGNGIVEGSEECDDGDVDDCNGCSGECQWERALMLDNRAAGAYVEDAPCLPTSSGYPFTMEMWFRIDRYPVGLSSCKILRMGSEFWLAFRKDGYGEPGFVLSFDPLSADIGVPGMPVPGSWHHIALVFWQVEHVKMFAIYYDGTRVKLVDRAPPLAIWACAHDGLPTIFLGEHDGSDLDCILKIDDVHYSGDYLYLHDFTPERRLVPRSASLAFWRFDAEVLGVIPDATGHGHHARLLDGELVADDCHMP